MAKAGHRRRNELQAYVRRHSDPRLERELGRTAAVAHGLGHQEEAAGDDAEQDQIDEKGKPQRPEGELGKQASEQRAGGAAEEIGGRGDARGGTFGAA